MVSMLVGRYTYVVGDAEEGRTAWQRNDVQLAVMEKQRLSKNILGELRIFIGKEYAKMFVYYYILYNTPYSNKVFTAKGLKMTAKVI